MSGIALTFEELETGATEDEIADDDGGSNHPRWHAFSPGRSPSFIVRCESWNRREEDEIADVTAVDHAFPGRR